MLHPDCSTSMAPPSPSRIVGTYLMTHERNPIFITAVI